jgi:glycosyltransferase involved in cell wall biosynthesis
MKGHLRFALVTTFFPPYHFGGDGLAVRRLAHAIARRGHEVEVVHDVDAFRALNKGPEPVAPVESEGVRVHRLQSRWGSLSCLATQQLGRPLVHGRRIRQILGRGFDVIHYHNVSLIGGPRILSYGSGIKLYTAHEHWLVCPTHVLWRHNREICDSRQCIRCVLRHRRPPQLWRAGGALERNSAHVDAFLTLSRFAADKHQEFGFNRKLAVIPPFLPDHEDGEAESDRPAASDRPFFLFVGRLEVIKGLQDVNPLFGHDAPAELWVAGSGAYEADLRRLAGSSSNVRFLGQKTPAQLRLLYRSCCGVVLPSRCFEVFPMVALEAFREGTPIVARRLGPFPEIIDQSNAGILFETPDQLRRALARLAGEDGLRPSLGRNGREAYRRLWSEGVAMNAYFGLIRGLASKRGGAENVRRAFSDIDSLPVV